MDFGTLFSSMASGAATPGYLTRLAQIESGFNPSAQNSNSSAGGLFQFLDSTWAGLGGGNKFDASTSTAAAVKLTNDNASYLSKILGRSPTDGEKYLAHQQGAAGAAKLLSNPSALAVDIVGSDAVLNNGGSYDMTAGEFASLWTSKFGDGETGSAAGGGTAASGLATYFIRGTVIILGFIFVAVGLAMFKPAMAFLPGPVKGAAKALTP